VELDPLDPSDPRAIEQHAGPIGIYANPNTMLRVITELNDLWDIFLLRASASSHVSNRI